MDIIKWHVEKKLDNLSELNSYIDSSCWLPDAVHIETTSPHSAHFVSIFYHFRRLFYSTVRIFCHESRLKRAYMSRSHNHHRLIATHRHQISTLHPLGHFPQSSDSRHLHLISTVTIKSHLSCKPLSGLVHTNSTDSLPDTNRCLGTLPVLCHPGTIFYPSSASCLFLCKRDVPITIS